MSMGLKVGDTVGVIWMDHEILVDRSSELIKLMVPTYYCSYGLYTGESDDGMYIVVTHNAIWNLESQDCIDTIQNDSTRILKSAIYKVFKMKECKPRLVNRAKKAPSAKRLETKKSRKPIH